MGVGFSSAAGEGLRPADLESWGCLNTGFAPASAGFYFRNPACRWTTGGPLPPRFYPGPLPPPPPSHLPLPSPPPSRVWELPSPLGLEEARQSPVAWGGGGGHERLRPGDPGAMGGHGKAWGEME